MDIKLQTRKCACKCGMVFKVMPKSKQKYASEWCADKSKWKAGESWKKARDKLVKSKKGTVSDDE